MQGRWLFPIKAAGTGTPTVFEKTPMSDGPMSTVRWVDMAVAPSGNVQLILDIFNKTGVPGVCEQAVLGAHTVVAPCGRGRGAVRLACGQRGHARPMVAGAERIITGQ